MLLCCSYRYNYGNHNGSIAWVWTVPSLEAERDPALELSCVKECAKNVTIFASRAEVKQWREVTENITKQLSPAVARALYCSATGMSLPYENEATAAIDARVQQVLDSGDPLLIVDFRLFNGAKPNPKVCRYCC